MISKAIPQRHRESLALLVWALLAFVPGDVWPGFLGIGATAPTEQSVAVEWSPSKGVVWQSPIVGHGQSSPSSDPV
jgi:hypothetical protein